jgi:hypothetical protein
MDSQDTAARALPAKDLPVKDSSSTKIIYRFWSRFLGGAAIGAFVVMVPMSFIAWRDLSSVQIGIATLIIISSGLLSSFFGKKFVDGMMQALESFTA